MLDRALIDSLFAPDVPEPEHWERRYPPRQLPAGAQVTRFGPSPTGFLNIGGIFTAMIDRDIATHSGGIYFVRIEDTDQSRAMPGALAQFDRAFSHFRVLPDESDETGDYGPYTQSQRAQVYHTYARQLLRQDLAYLCFATKDELAALTAQQNAAKVPTGYYGQWAPWRNADEAQVKAALAEGRPYVVRLRAPDQAGRRVRCVDAIRGELNLEANRNDAVILKSSDSPLPLPTYHFAHAVDDHLMRVTVVIRGEEWIPSIPLHLQLFEALRFEPIEYAHIAPLLKQDGGSKRKLSKRKDPEATADFYLQVGYPVDAVLYYLRCLANGRLAELPVPQALAEPLRLAECSVSGALVDLVKLEDICADVVAQMPGPQILRHVKDWADEYDPTLARVVEEQSDLALRALSIERDGVDNPRKDLRKWSDFRRVYGYFFADLFDLITDSENPLFGGLEPSLIRDFAADFVATYAPLPDPQQWFEQIRELAARHGFAPSPKQLKAEPGRYPGSIREAAQLIRVALTGSTRSPDLFAVASTLGADEVRRRVGALAG